MQRRSLMVAALLGSAFAGDFARAVTPTDEQALASLSQQWMAAIEHKDRPALEALLAPDFTLRLPGDEESQVVQRAEWLDNAIRLDWTDFHYDNVRVHVHEDSATVSSRLSFKVSPNPLTFDSGVVDSWEKRDGRWQVSTRYLGESRLKQRMAFAFGIGAVLLAWGLVHLARRFRARNR